MKRTIGMLVLFVGSISVFAETPGMKIVSDLDFTKSKDMAGWTFDPNNGKVAVMDKFLRIESLSGKGKEWNSQTIQYTPGFSVEEATVRIEVDVARQNIYRDFHMAIHPKSGHMFREPAVWFHIDHGTSSSLLVRQWEGGAQKHPIPQTKLPFVFDSGVKVVLTLAKGTGTLTLTKGAAAKTIKLGTLIAPKWQIEPFTVLIGTSQHGNSNDPAVADISRVRISTTKGDEATAAESVGNGPGKDDTVTYVDLTPYANRRFEDETADDKVGGWTDQGSNDMRFIPKGYQFFRNVPFYISDKLAVVGNAPEPGCIILGSKNSPAFMMETKPMAVNAPAAYLYFLQAAAWSGENIHCADYIVKYTDGTTASIPMRTGIDLGEWWEPKDTPKAVVAWRGRNPAKDNVGFYLHEWTNPNPDKKIESIVFRSTNSTAVPILLGITASPKKIDIGPHPRPYQDPGAAVCEYRERIKTAPNIGQGPSKLTVTRTLPIAKESQVKQARIDIVRYRAQRPAKVTCTLAGVTKTASLPAGELRARFLFTEKDVAKFLTEHKDAFTVAVSTDDPAGFEARQYETNPNHDWIPNGEDFEHGAYAVTGVYMITPFLPDHKYSAYVENRPKGVKPLPIVREESQLTPAAAKPDWLGSKICLSSIWQWQPGARKGFVPPEAKIPTKDWQDILIPANVGPMIFEKDQYCISAWFKKDLFVPTEWQDKRLAIQFDSVSDFATVFCNGKKLLYHEGVAAFAVDLTPAVKFLQTNTIVDFAENGYK